MVGAASVDGAGETGAKNGDLRPGGGGEEGDDVRWERPREEVFQGGHEL